MPDHEARIKPLVAEQKRKKNNTVAAQEPVLSARPVTGTGVPVAETGSASTGTQDKAKAYLVDYLAKNSRTAVNNGSPSSKPVGESIVEPVAETGGTISGEEVVKEEKKTGLQFIDPSLTEKVFTGKLAKASKLAKTTAKTKPAAVKITESEKAQDKPETEQQSDSNESQVGSFAGQPVAEKTKRQSENALHAAIEQEVPTTLGGLKDFKKEGRAQNISRAVMQQVSADVESVKQNFGGMAQSPAPAPAHKGEPLPPPETADHVQPIGMGAGVVPPLQPEHLDTQQYLDQTEAILKKEEVNTEYLEEVTSGELADAKAEMATLKKDAANEPKNLKSEAAAEHEKLRREMESEEKDARKDMGRHRSGRLKESGEKQVRTKTKLEKERDAVAKNINTKFETCQASIIGQLNDLEKSSLKRFDDGQAMATTVFENQVNKDIEEFKRKRYDTDLLTRGYRKVHDWFLGINQFPEVKEAFTNAKNTYVKSIDLLIGNITTDNNKVINACKKQLQDTRKDIADYVKGLKSSLRDVGRKAMGEVNEKLKQLSEEIDRRKESLQKQLADKRQAAMKAIDDKIAKMKEKLSGAVARVGKWLADFALKAFKWACNLLGLDAESILNALRRAGQAFMAIIKHLGKFFSNLKNAVGGAIDNFTANAKQYMGEILISWLTGAMGTAIVFPKTLDAKGVLSIIMQIANISKEYIRKKLVSVFGEERLRKAGQSLAPVKLLLSGDIMGLWEWIKDRAQGLMTAFIESVKDWIFTKLILGLGKFIVSLFLPGGGLVKAVQAIYKLVMWFVNNIQRIVVWVNSVLDSFSNIANSAIAAAIKTIVAAMKQIMVVVLDFFATLLNVGKISQEIRKIIDKIVQPIHDAIDKFIAWIREKIKTLFGKGDKKKEEKQKAANDDQRSPAQMQKDLNSGVSEATSYLRSGDRKTKKDIDKHLQQIEAKYLLSDLALVVDKKNENGKELVHVHGKVNPEKDGEKVEVEIENDISAEEAHRKVMEKMDDDKKRLLRGHLDFVAGYAGRTFTTETRDSVDEIGYRTGDHSDPSIKEPGTSTIDPKTKFGKLNKPNWIPDHQPPDILISGGAKEITFRFYPHSNESRRKQGGVVRVYKMWMKQIRNRGESNWAEGVKSNWFW